ncbi:hypothetical protein GGF46_005492, partial [Coemansia sp. RSA 552]
KGLAGSMIWSINQDYNNELLDVAVAFGSGSAKKRDGSEADDVDEEAPASRAPAAF